MIAQEPYLDCSEIAWWMLDLYFGLDASGFDHASKIHTSRSYRYLLNIIADFHSVFGPMLMVTYACLSNTLLLTGKLAVLFLS